MKDKNNYFYRVLHIIGLLVCVVGFILVILQKESRYGWFAVIIGALIAVFANPYKTVYICPKCGTKFESKDKIVLTTSLNSAIKRSLVTCPKCKKTNFCRSKSVCNDGDYKE